MIKKVISVLLILTVLLNVIGFGFFDLKSAAVAVVDDVAIFVGSVTLGLLAGLAGEAIERKAPEIEQYIQGVKEGWYDNLNEEAIKNGELINVEYDSFHEYYYFSPAPGLSSKETELADKICNKLNESDNVKMLISGFEASVNGLTYGEDWRAEVGSELYSSVKTDVVNAFYDSLLETGQQELINTGELHKYSFDFVGPIQEYTIPSIDGRYSTLIKNGYELSVPFCIMNEDAKFLTEPKTVCGLTVSSCYGDEGAYEPYVEITTGKGCYGYGSYIVYNNEIYYMAFTDVGTEYSTHPGVPICGIMYDSNIASYYTSDGKCLADNINSKSDLVGCFAGMYFYKSPDVTKYPENTIAPSELMSEGIQGVSLEPEMTVPETLISQAIKEKLFPEEIPIELNENGEIVGANGIDINTLQQILSKLNSGENIKFDDIKSYLEAIKAACEGTNLDTGKIQSILNTVATQMVTAKDIDDALKDINEYLKSLSEALTIPQEAELELTKPDIDADMWTIRHTGLPESKFIVDRIPIIDQCKEFLNNLLDGDKYSTAPPSFSFYWDSDKDGTVEKYTALDLSFLETRLTNENLEDKRYFTSAMTVRQFIQYLIILICYTAFVLKMLRKLPGLVSGGESAGSDFLMTEKQNR